MGLYSTAQALFSLPACVQPQNEPFWYIKMVHGTAQTQFYWARDRLFDRPIVQILFEIVSAQEHARVTDVRSQYVLQCPVN